MRDTVPEALPATYESSAGEEEFCWGERFLFRDAAVHEGVTWQAHVPFTEGSIVGVLSPFNLATPPFVTVSLDVNELALADDSFRERLPGWVGAIGSALGSFYAAGAVQENLALRRGKPVATLGSRTRVLKVMDAERWLGLPWSGVAFEWFGPHYLPHIGETAHHSGQPVGDGAFVAYASKEERLRVLPTALLNAHPDGRPATVIPALRTGK
jgi:hypothetical protein